MSTSVPFVKFLTCDRKTALEHPVHGFRTHYLEASIYFFCERVEGGEFTSDELKQLYEYPDCCYEYGHKCNPLECYECSICEHDEKQCEHAHYEYDCVSSWTFEIDEDSIETEEENGLIPPRFWLLTPSLVLYKDNTNVFDSADTRCTTSIYKISDIALKLEAYNASASERKLIQKFWSTGMTADLFLKDFHVLPNKEWFDYCEYQPCMQSKKRKR